MIKTYQMLEIGNFDNKRSTFNVGRYLRPNVKCAEETEDYVDFLSNGFKLEEIRQWIMMRWNIHLTWLLLRTHLLPVQVYRQRQDKI